MLRHVTARIRYRYITVDDELNPVSKFVEKDVRAFIIESFSDNYYNDRGRTQQQSLNLVVNDYIAMPAVVSENQTAPIYQVVVGGVTFGVDRVLKYKQDSRKKILDCQQVTG